ncbi:hypothetical protein L1049_005370 [Liquidambar formosana]|uniref:Uncharacterized protein n=1 Tax=Liquidambar formosana TaxID=63359 RepID=A0AAP0RU73_LIQFO
MATLMASKALLLQNPNPTFHSPRTKQPHRHYTNATTLSLLPFPKPLSLSLHKLKPYTLRQAPKSRVFASSASSPTIPNTPSTNLQNPTQFPLTESTRTISTIFALALSLSSSFINVIRQFSLKVKGICLTPAPEELATIQNLQENLVCTVGPLFFRGAEGPSERVLEHAVDSGGGGLGEVARYI